MQCPVCDVTLSISSREGVEIDFCPQCRGVWLDRGELDKIIDRVNATMAASPQTLPPPPPAPAAREADRSGGDPRRDRDDDRRDRDDRDRYGRDDRDRDDRYRERADYDKRYDKRKKRRSMLEDLFDFD